jgi:hypothetical protein
MQTLSDAARLGMSMRFRVSVDGINLGSWATCAGLSVEFKNKRIAEGGNYEYSVILPDRVEYRTVTLRRAMSAQESAIVQQWLTGVVSGWYNAGSPRDYGPADGRDRTVRRGPASRGGERGCCATSSRRKLERDRTWTPPATAIAVEAARAGTRGVPVMPTRRRSSVRCRRARCRFDLNPEQIQVPGSRR